MKLVKFLVVFALLLSFGAVQAQDRMPDANAEKKICRAVGAATGSILSRKRECRTKAEWAAIAKAEEANRDRFRDSRENSRVTRESR